ncbi:MAG: helix-turn-helix domain-containing protein [Pirellulales bacterium]
MTVSRETSTRRLLAAKEASELLPIGKRKLWSPTNAGENCHVKIGSAVRYDVDDLLSWIVKRKRGG